MGIAAGAFAVSGTVGEKLHCSRADSDCRRYLSADSGKTRMSKAVPESAWISPGKLAGRYSGSVRDGRSARTFLPGLLLGLNGRSLRGRHNESRLGRNADG